MDKNYITNGVFGATAPTIKATLAFIQTTNAISYKVDGNVYSLGANANTAGTTAIPSTIIIPAKSTGSIAVYVDPGGTFTFAQGTSYLNTSLQNTPFQGLQAPQSSTTIYSTQTATSVYSTIGLPQEQPNKALLGWAIVNATSTTVWTGGTSKLDGTGGYTVTFIDKFGFVGI